MQSHTTFADEIIKVFLDIVLRILCIAANTSLEQECHDGGWAATEGLPVWQGSNVLCIHRDELAWVAGAMHGTLQLYDIYHTADNPE